MSTSARKTAPTAVSKEASKTVSKPVSRPAAKSAAKAPAKAAAKAPGKAVAVVAAKGVAVKVPAKVPAKTARMSSREAMLARVESVRLEQRSEGHFDCFGRAGEGYCDQGACAYHAECLSVSRLLHSL